MPARPRLRTVLRLALPACLALLLAVAGAGGAPTSPPVAPTAAADLARQANEQPTAAFDHDPARPEPGETIVLNASASNDPDGEIASYRWDIDGDNVTDMERGPNVRIAFPKAGEYPVRLTVVDGEGATATTNRTIDVEGTEPPVARLTLTPTEVETGETVTIDARDSADPDGSIVSWSVDTDGDGTFEEQYDSPPRLQVGYDSPGEYTVALRVEDNDGMTSTAIEQVVVEAGSPEGTESATRSPSVATDSPGQPGFGLLVGLLAVLLATVVVGRGSSSENR